MREREAPFWVWGEGPRELVLSTPAPIEATIWIDGDRARTLRVEGTTSASIELPGAGWHVVMLELPASSPRSRRAACGSSGLSPLR